MEHVKEHVILVKDVSFEIVFFGYEVDYQKITFYVGH